MKNLIILPLLLLFISITSCSDNQLIIGSGSTTTEFRNVSDFSKISSEGVFDITIIQGNTQTVEITADDNIIHKIKTKVIGNELRLTMDDNTNYRNINIKVNITVLSINSIRNSGVGHISIFNVDTPGYFDVYNTGTGNISIAGSAESLRLENKGTGKFKGFQFMVFNCELEIIGSGDCEVNVIDDLNLDIKGSGDVLYKGTPSIDAKISGSGKVVNAN